MNKINISTFATLVLLSTSSLIAEDAVQIIKPADVKVVEETTFKNLVEAPEELTKTEIEKKDIAITSPAKVIEQKEVVVKEVTVVTPEKVIETEEVKKAVETPKKEETQVKKEIPVEIKKETLTQATEVKTAEVVKQAVQKPSQVPAVRTSDVVITMPAVPKPPQVKVIVPKLIVLDSDGKLITKDSMNHLFKKEEHQFSSNVAPARFNRNVEHKKEEILAGDIADARVAAYLHTALVSVDDAKANLEKAGFEILSTFKVDKKGKINSIVFTNDAMKQAASKSTRGFAGTLRLTIDTKNKLTIIANPIYMMKAFMQKEYSKETAVSTLKSIRTAFPAVKNSEELVKFIRLERFQFMENMPFYQDMKTVAQGKNADLLKKAEKSKKVTFVQHLDNGSTVVGVKLGKRTSKFVKKIGYQNSGLLPYPVLIEDGKAKILAPQYYIAVMYPRLKMSQFMTIATVPGAILKDIDRVFR